MSIHRKPCNAVATLGILGLGGGATFAVAYDAIVNGSQSSTTLLGTISVGALSALVVLAGGRAKE